MDKHLPVSVWPEWKIVEKIGEGSFGKVYKACRTEQGTTFYSAIKVITIPSNQGELSSVRSESPNEQSVKEYFQGLVDECIQEVGLQWNTSVEILMLFPLKTIKLWNIWMTLDGIFLFEWNILQVLWSIVRRNR